MNVRIWLTNFLNKMRVLLSKVICDDLRVRKLSILLLFCVSSTSTLSETIIPETDAVYRFSINIDARAEEIWPFLFRMDKWKYSVKKIDRVRLDACQEGGVVAIYQGGESQEHRVLIRTEKIELNTRYAFSIYSSLGNFLGFAAYDLKEVNGKTQLTYDIYMHGVLADIDRAEQKYHQKLMSSKMKARQKAELNNLKELVAIEKGGLISCHA